MIEAIAKMGELEIEELRKQGENESKYFVENINFKGGDKLVLLNIINKKIETIEIVDLDKINYYNLLYGKRKGSNVANLSITTRYNLDKTLLNEGLRKFRKLFDKNLSNLPTEFIFIKGLINDEILNKIEIKLKEINDARNVLISYKIDNKFIGEIKEFKELFYNYFFDKYRYLDSKKSIDTQKEDSVSYMDNNKTIVWGGVPDLPFFTLDKPGFAYGLNQTEITNMFSYNKKKLIALILGKQILKNKFNFSFGGQDYFLIPNFANNFDNELLKNFEKLGKIHSEIDKNHSFKMEQLEEKLKIKKDKINKKQKEDIIKTEEELSVIKEASDVKTLNYNFLFYKKGHSALRIISFIEEILPSQLSKVVQTMNYCDKYFQKDLDISKINFNQRTIFDLFPSNSKSDKRIFFEVLNSVLENEPISYNFILSRLLNKLRTSKEFSKDGKKIYYTNLIESVKCLVFFKKLNLFENTQNYLNNHNPLTYMNDNIYTISFEELFNDYLELFDNRNELKACFALGFLLNSVKSKQYTSLKSSPILNSLKSLKLRKSDILELKNKIEGKAREYDINGDIHESLNFYFLETKKNPKDWKINDDELNFYISLGLNLSYIVWEKYKKNNRLIELKKQNGK